MVKIVNECCDCAGGAYPCLGESCEKRHVKHPICDKCHAEVKTLYDVDGQQLCEACLNGTSDDGITPIDPECIPFY